MAGAMVVVSDDGPGIPAGDRDLVLQRFARLHDACDRDSGCTGLGLAIVRELVGQHAGRVRLLDADGGGLRVELWFPAAERSQIVSDERTGGGGRPGR